MPIETTLLVLPVTDLAILGGLAALCCVLGWQLRRLATRGREAALKRNLFEAKGAVPQLESAVRRREQQTETLVLELKAVKARVSEQEVALRQQESLVVKREREIRSLNSELAIVKDGVSSEQVLLDGDFGSAEPATADPELGKRYAALEARYEAMKRGMIKRDDRIAELEDALKNPDGEVPTRSLEQELSDIEQTAATLKATLEERETQLETLQASLQDAVAERQALEDLAKRRSEGNRELKANAAKFEQQIPALLQTIESHDVQIAERDARLQAVSGDLAGERRTRAAREAEIEDLQAQLATATTRQRDLQQRLHEQDEARRALDTELTNTKDALRATESVVRTHEATIAEAERRLAEARERIETDERTAATLRHAIEDREFRIEGLEAAARQQEAKLEMLRTTFFEAKQTHKDHISELKARYEAQSQVLDALTAEHDRLRAEATAHETRVARLEQDLAERDEFLAAQRAAGRAQADELAASRGELNLAGRSADALTRQAAQLTDALTRSNSALRRSQSTALLLVARLSAPTLLLPAPVSPAQKNTNDRTTTFFRHGASSGAVQSMAALWNDQRDTEPSVTES